VATWLGQLALVLHARGKTAAAQAAAEEALATLEATVGAAHAHHRNLRAAFPAAAG
jgi:hypothetical protein